MNSFFKMLGLRPRKRLEIRAKCEWDEEAGVWYVSESSLPGLCADADTLEALAEKIFPMIQDLIVEQHTDSANDSGHEIADVSLLLGQDNFSGRLKHC